MRDDETTRAALAARAGDEFAAADFVRATQRDVWLLLAHLVSRSEASDLTQETYLRAFRALPRFRGEATARTWLLAITRRVAADHLRARRRQPAIEPDAESAVQGRAEGGDLAERVALRRLIAGLVPEQRAAFVLTQLLGLSYAEAAEICGCPVGTIRSRVARARASLVEGHLGSGPFIRNAGRRRGG